MRRREFIQVMAGSAAAWPLAARARQSALPVIGWLNSGPADDPLFMSFANAFRAGLKDAGYAEGQNVAIDFRWGEGQYSRLPTLAAELVAKRVDVIVAGGPTRCCGCQSSNPNNPDHFHVRRRPDQAGSCRQPKQTRRQCHWRQSVRQRARSQTVGSASGRCAGCGNDRQCCSIRKLCHV